MNSSKIRQAFNLRDNFRDLYRPESQRMMFMDGLRCLGMFHVMLSHSILAFLMGFRASFQEYIQSFPWYLRWMLAGDKAVDLFFVISGFLIGQMLFREYNRNRRIDLKRFFLRRFWRLAPAYYLVILVFALTAGPQVEKIYLWAFVFYVNNFIGVEHNYIHFAWSLAIEEQFYAVFSLFVAFVFFRINRQLLFLVLLYLFSFVILFGLLAMNPDIVTSVDNLISGPGQVSDKFWEMVYDNLHTRYGCIVAGIILAHLYVYHWGQLTQRLTEQRCRYLLLLALALFVLSMVLPVYDGNATSRALLYFYHTTHRNLFGLGVMLVMLLCLLDRGIGGRINRSLSSRVFYPVSQLTYSMYLLHLPVIGACYLLLKANGLIDAISHQNVYMVFFFSIIPTILVSMVMYVLVERPFMKMRS